MGFFKKDKNQAVTRQPAMMAGQDDYTFRRSRAITGSASSAVNSAAEDRSRLSSPRLKLHQLQRHRRGIVAGLIISAAAIGLLGWTVGQYVILPTDFSYRQALNDQPNTEPYAQTIKQYFNQHPTERFLFNLRANQLNDQIIRQHPEVKQVTIHGLSPGIFDVSVEFRQPLLSWRSGGKQLYVDSQGVAFEKNLFASPAVTVDDQSGIKLDNTNLVASGRFISFLGQLVSQVNAGGVDDVSKVIIPTGTTREVDIVLKNRTYPIKTHIDRDPRVQAHDVVAAVRYIEGRGVKPEYIDARVEGKAFYR